MAREPVGAGASSLGHALFCCGRRLVALDCRGAAEALKRNGLTMKRSMRLARLVGMAVAGLIGLGAASSAADDCTWTRQRDGTQTAVCKDGVGRNYCLTCSFSPRVCQRTPC